MDYVLNTFMAFPTSISDELVFQFINSITYVKAHGVTPEGLSKDEARIAGFCKAHIL